MTHLQALELSQAQVLAVIQSLLADELKSLRPQASQEINLADWDAQTFIKPAPAPAVSLHADSLELLALATRVVDFFEIRSSGLEDYLLRYKTLGEWAQLVVEARKRGSQNLTFQTSGSQGEPKPCAQLWSTLVDEIDYFIPLLQQDQPIQRILALSPCHHIYGFLFSVILAERLQVPVVRETQAFFAVQGRQLKTGDLIVGFPFIWKQLARSGQPFPSGVQGLTSTGPSDAAVIQQLCNQGLQQMTEIYGSSETGGIGYRKDPQAAFELLPRWQRFEQHPDLLLEVATGDLVPLNDHLKWHSSQLFLPQGRLDAGVQVAGLNVFPELIAAQLESLPGVAAARVRLMAPHEGERLKAFIQPTDEAAQNPQALLASLENWCRKHLKAAEQPKAFTLGAELPVNELGKDCDWPLIPAATRPQVHP